jgi:hypothetical protein
LSIHGIHTSKLTNTLWKTLVNNYIYDQGSDTKTNAFYLQTNTFKKLPTFHPVIDIKVLNIAGILNEYLHTWVPDLTKLQIPALSNLFETEVAVKK